MILDASRLQTVRSNIAGAGELTLNAIMSDYNVALEEMYGLFANTTLMDAENPEEKNEKIARALQSYFQQTIEGRFLPEVGRDGEFVQNTINSLVDKGMRATNRADEEDLTDFLKVQLENFTADPVSGSALANPNTLKRQIVEYMKYRGPISVASTLLGKIDYLKDSGKQADACDNKIEYTKKLGELQDPCLAAYEAIESEYNMGAMLINELVGEGIANHSDKIQELLKDSQKQYEMATAFYLMDMQSPFNNTGLVDGVPKGNFYDYASLRAQKISEELGSNNIAEKNIKKDEEGKDSFTYDSDFNNKPGEGEGNDVDTRIRKHIDAMNKIVEEIEKHSSYGVKDSVHDTTNKKLDTPFDSIISNITQPGRAIDDNDGSGAELEGFSASGEAQVTAIDYDGHESDHPYLCNIESNDSRLRKFFKDLPDVKYTAEGDFITQLTRAKEIYQIQQDLDDKNKYKKDITEYAYTHNRIQALYKRMDDIWGDLEKDVIEGFKESVKEDEQKLAAAKAHNAFEQRKVDECARLHAAWESVTEEEWGDEFYDAYVDYDALPDWGKTYVDNFNKWWDGDPSVPDKPTLSTADTEPKYTPDFQPEIPIHYYTRWNTYCSGIAGLDDIDMHHTALKQILDQMEHYGGCANAFIAEAAHHNKDYFLKYAEYYNESGYSGVAGVVITLKMMQEGLKEAYSQLNKIIEIITTDKGDDKCLETRKKEWHDSIVGNSSTGQQGVNSDSTKAAMLSDYNTLADQFDKKEVESLKKIIGGDDGSGGLIKQVTDMMSDMTGIMYLKQSLFKYTSAAKAFADQARQELEDKMEGKCKDFFNPAKSPIIQALNEKAWQKILGD